MRYKLAMVCAVLALAAGSGAARAASCSTLYALAQEHASDMARRDSLDHNGFFTYRGPHGAMAENVAVGCKTEACARDAWMKSPHHRANMMLGGCQAVASAVSKSGRRYWAMEIGGGGGGVGVAKGRHGKRHYVSFGGYPVDGAIDNGITP